MSVAAKLESSLKASLGDDFAKYRFVLAVSGGRDSMALLRNAASILPKLAVAHFNHHLRGSESDADARFVAAQARKLKIAFHLGHGDGDRRDEASLRLERWNFLQQVREDTRSDLIVTGHTADDQLETFLMRFLRGTGLKGLAVMAPKRGVILRPLLQVTRAEIEREGGSYREDTSNADEIYFRNRVRRKLLPVLYELAGEFGGEAALLRRFSALQGEIQQAASLADRQAKRAYQRRFAETSFWFRARDGKLEASVLRECWKRLCAPTPSRDEMSRVVGALSEGKRKHTFPGGVEVERSCGYLFFTNAEMRRRLRQATLLDLGAEIKIGPSLECRFPRPGDRYGGTKLKRLLLEKRIPAPERRILPVVAKPGSASVSWFFPLESSKVSVHRVEFPFTLGPITAK